MGDLFPLNLRGVGLALGGKQLLNGIDLEIQSGSRTMVMGPNGAGKSLLLRVMHGLMDPTQGRVTWGNASNDRNLRNRQAMVFQRPVMLRRSALANLTHALGLRGMGPLQRRKLALDALERFGLSYLAKSPARVLSGGEQQRLALARAWAMQPEVLFLDEPTAALDPAATLAVEQAVRDFHGSGTTIVMTTHDLGQAKRLADQVIFMVGGKVVEFTKAPEFFQSPVSPQAKAFLAGEIVT